MTSRVAEVDPKLGTKFIRGWSVRWDPLAAHCGSLFLTIRGSCPSIVNMLFAAYPYETEVALVGDIDKLARKVKKRRRKLAVPDRRSPYAVDLNDAAMYVPIGGHGGGLLKEREEVSGAMPIVAGVPDVESLPSTPHKRHEGLPDVSSLFETQLTTPVGGMSIEERLQLKIAERDSLEAKINELKRVPLVSSSPHKKPSKKVVQLEERLRTLNDEVAGLNIALSGEQMRQEEVRKKLDIGASRERAAREEAEEKARVERAVLEEQLAFSSLKEKLNAEPARYRHFNTKTGEVRLLDTNLQNLPYGGIKSAIVNIVPDGVVFKPMLLENPADLDQYIKKELKRKNKK